MEFSGQVIWITGATSGLGRAMAIEFAMRGAYVVPSGRRGARLAEVCDELNAVSRAPKDQGVPSSLGIQLDVTDEASVQSAMQDIIAMYDRLDVVVANAGFGVSGAFSTLSTEDWKRQFDVNVFGLITTIRHALPHLESTRGRVALVSSVLGMLAMPNNGAYTASKYAVRAIGQTLSMELHGTGVSCTTIYPGFVESEIGQVDNEGVHSPERRDKRPAKLLWKTDRAARVMVRAISRRERDYVFTAHGRLGAWIGQHFPTLAYWALRRRAS